MSESGLVPRILSIRKNRGIGYAIDTGFQVLNAIMQSGADNKQWDTLYTMAVKAYGLETQFTQPGVCREAIADDFVSRPFPPNGVGWSVTTLPSQVAAGGRPLCDQVLL